MPSLDFRINGLRRSDPGRSMAKHAKNAKESVRRVAKDAEGAKETLRRVAKDTKDAKEHTASTRRTLIGEGKE